MSRMKYIYSMKTISFIALAVTIISCSSPSSEKKNIIQEDTSEIKDGNYQKVDTFNFTGADGLKQGKWIENNYSKNPSEGVYKNSLKEGIWTEYYDQHRLTIKNRITYVNGKMEGTAVLFDSLTHDSTTGEYVGGKFIPDSKSK